MYLTQPTERHQLQISSREMDNIGLRWKKWQREKELGTCPRTVHASSSWTRQLRTYSASLTILSARKCCRYDACCFGELNCESALVVRGVESPVPRWSSHPPQFFQSQTAAFKLLLPPFSSNKCANNFFQSSTMGPSLKTYISQAQKQNNNAVLLQSQNYQWGECAFDVYRSAVQDLFFLCVANSYLIAKPAKTKKTLMVKTQEIASCLVKKDDTILFTCFLHPTTSLCWPSTLKAWSPLQVKQVWQLFLLFSSCNRYITKFTQYCWPENIAKSHHFKKLSFQTNQKEIVYVTTIYL